MRNKKSYTYCHHKVSRSRIRDLACDIIRQKQTEQFLDACQVGGLLIGCTDRNDYLRKLEDNYRDILRSEVVLDTKIAKFQMLAICQVLQANPANIRFNNAENSGPDDPQTADFDGVKDSKDGSMTPRSTLLAMADKQLADAKTFNKTVNWSEILDLFIQATKDCNSFTYGVDEKGHQIGGSSFRVADIV